MTRTIVDIDDEMLARAQRALETPTKRDTINLALKLAAAIDVERRTQALDSFRELLGRLDRRLIDGPPADQEDIAKRTASAA